MSYIDYEFYTSLYGEIPEADFNRLSWDACRRMDVLTTGVDNVKKLKVAFPTDEDDSEAVRRCACALVDILFQVKQAEEMARSASGYTETEDGLKGKVISSQTAGTTSISYAVGKSSTAETWVSEAMANPKVLDEKIYSTIHDYLSGITDANGVNLLLMAKYPRCIRKE